MQFELLQRLLWQQFGASLDMVSNAIRMCPDTVWDNDRKFWYNAFHCLWFTDYYLTRDAASFHPPAPFDRSEFEDRMPDRTYTRDELLTYTAYCRQKCRNTTEGLTPESAAGVWRNESRTRAFPFFELQLYNMRHVQHHAAQLNILLRQSIDDAPRWVSRAGRYDESPKTRSRVVNPSPPTAEKMDFPALKGYLWQQFGASIDMLENAVRMCPARLWETPAQFWYKVFHTLFFLDIYLAFPPDGYLPPDPFDMSEAEDRMPHRTYTKPEILGYLDYCREKCIRVISGLTPESAAAIWNNPTQTRPFPFVELMMYNMRHVQHHAAQLNKLLRQGIDDAPGWVSRAKAEV